MTQSNAAVDSTTAISARGYGRSVLLTGCARMSRATVAAMLAVTGNAAVQSLLTWVNSPIGRSAGFVVSVAVSGLALALTFAVLTAAGLEAVDGGKGLGATVSRVRANLGRFVGWILPCWVLSVVAQMLLPGLAAVVALILVFVPLAAMDGRGNPLAVNFGVIRQRLGRWLLTSAIIGLGSLLWFLVAALNTFFVKGTVASFIIWMIGGTLVWWLQTAWAGLYRSTRAGSV